MDFHINVATTAMPRTLVGHCLGSFLDAMHDRDHYHLHWVCHLDHYEGLDHLHPETLEQIHALCPRFDEHTVLAPDGNQEFGGSVLSVLKQLKYDTLWIEDDWDWTGKQFRLADVIAKTTDCYSFLRVRVNAGAMHPTFWKWHVLQYTLEHFPADLESVSEITMFRMLKDKFKSLGESLLTLEKEHIGNTRMVELGFDRGWNGQRLVGKRHMPRWDKRKREWLQQ